MNDQTRRGERQRIPPPAPPALLLDIGNTHSHATLSKPGSLGKKLDFPTAWWREGRALDVLRRLVGRAQPEWAALCSVVPWATRHALVELERGFGVRILEVTHRSVGIVGVRYPHPETIGPDRLANAAALRILYGAPALAIDFGTAVTFDVLDANGSYVGGIIAPGLAAMTDYLHEKTALLPRIRVRPIRKTLGKSTEEAMLIGAVRGYRHLVRGLITDSIASLGGGRVPVVVTGGYGALIAHGIPEITEVNPWLTLQGIRLVLEFHLARQRGDS